MAGDPQFTVFRNLPPEIRIKIWKDALPDRDSVFDPQLFTFERGCWKIKTKSTPSQRPDVPEPFVESSWEFDHSMLGKPQCKVTLGAVNREARDVAISWVRTLGGGPNESMYPVFIRPFVGDNDGMYVSADQWGDFANEPTMVSMHYVRELCHITSNVRRLVLPESAIKLATPSELRRAFLFFQQVKEVFIVADDSDGEAVSTEDDHRIRGRLFQPRMGAYAFSWSRVLGRFLPLNPVLCKPDKMEGYIDEFLYQLAPVLAHTPRLEVRNIALGPHINDCL